MQVFCVYIYVGKAFHPTKSAKNFLVQYFPCMSVPISVKLKKDTHIAINIIEVTASP